MRGSGLESSSERAFFTLAAPNPRNDRVCAFAAALESGAAFDTLVDPEAPFSRVNAAIYGVSSDSVYAKPNFRGVWEGGLGAFLSGKVLVGYNADFDLRILAKTLEAYGIELPVWRFVDLLPAARRLWDLSCYALSDVMAELDAPWRGETLSDTVAATGFVYDAIKREEPELLTPKYWIFTEEKTKLRW